MTPGGGKRLLGAETKGVEGPSRAPAGDGPILRKALFIGLGSGVDQHGQDGGGNGAGGYQGFWEGSGRWGFSSLCFR